MLNVNYIAISNCLNGRYNTLKKSVGITLITTDGVYIHNAKWFIGLGDLKNKDVREFFPI